MDLGRSNFDLGDVGFTVSSKKEPAHKQCPFCNGDKVIIGADGQTATCPKCSGKGYSNDWDAGYNLVTRIEGPLTITGITLEIVSPDKMTFWGSQKGRGLIYRVKGYSDGKTNHIIEESRMLPSKEAAEVEEARIIKKG